MSKFPQIVVLALAAAGCSTSSDPQVERPVPTNAYVYAPSASAALAFDPPIIIGQAMPSFGRDGRSPEAFAGYEEQVTTYSYTHQRDEIRVQNDHGSLNRRAYTDRTSVTTR